MLLADFGRAPLDEVLRSWLNLKEADDLDSALLKVHTTLSRPGTCCCN